MRVGFVGAYCTANFGDWAILVNNIEDINANENVIFTYSDSFPHSAVAYHLPDENTKFVEVKADNFQEINHVLTPLDFIKNISNVEQIRKEVSSLDVLCVSGGGYLDDNWCSRTEKFVKIMAPIILAKQENVRIVFMSQEIGPIVDTKESMRFLFRYIADAPIAIRDNFASPTYLSEIGVDSRNVHFLPDDLLFINNKFKKIKNVGDAPYIVVVIHDTMDFIKENSSIFVDFATIMKKKYNLDILFLPFDLVWYGYDQSKYLSQIIPSAKMVDCDKFLPIEDVYSYINNAELVLTGRYHAAIVAQQTHTPFLVKLGISRWGRTYSYNKVYGSLQNLLFPLNFRDDYFMTIDWQDTFSFVSECFNEVTTYQKNLYSNPIVCKNEEQLHGQRIKYIKKYVTREIE